MAEAAVDIVDLAEQPALVVRREIDMQDIATTLAEILPRVFGHAVSAGGQIAGMPFMRYFEMDGTTMSIAAGVPVAAPMEGAEDIEPHMLPGGRTLTAIHRGEYGGVGAVWNAVWKRARELGSTGRFGGWDVYANDPGEVAPEDVETHVFLPLDGGD